MSHCKLPVANLATANANTTANYWIIGLPAPDHFPFFPLSTSLDLLSTLIPGHWSSVGFGLEEQITKIEKKGPPPRVTRKHDWELCLAVGRCDSLAATFRAGRPRRLDSRWLHCLEADPDVVRCSRRV